MDHTLVKLELKRLFSVVSATHRRDLTGLNNAFQVQTYALKIKGLFIIPILDMIEGRASHKVDRQRGKCDYGPTTNKVASNFEGTKSHEYFKEISQLCSDSAPVPQRTSSLGT